MELTLYKEKIAGLFKRSNPVSTARNKTLSLLMDGRISQQEAEEIMSGFAPIQVNIQNLTIDHSMRDITNWGSIANGKDATAGNGSVSSH